MQVLLWGLLALVLVRTAWVCDDAFITLRCVDNATHGYGLTYNVVERVQAFTHPLWAMLLLPLHAVFADGYDEVIVLGLLLSLAGLAIGARGLENRWAWLAMPLLAISSKAWIEYATSGLENSLGYLLIAFFVVEWWHHLRTNNSIFKLALLTCLIALTRMDLLVLVGPACAVACWQARSWRMCAQAALGFLPFFAWELFSVVYYGFPFPNTAYAKLATGISTSQLIPLGWHYLLDSLHRDWITLPLICVAIWTGLRSRLHRPLAIGLGLYLIYIVRIGGDFMSGRFLAIPFLLGLLLVSHRLGESWMKWLGLAGLATVLGLLAPTPMLLSGRDFPRAMRPDQLVSPTGVADERAFFYPGTGLLHDLGKRTVPYFPWQIEGQSLAKAPPSVSVRGTVGMAGYFAGPKQHVLDLYGLTDPLMARLPAIYSLKPRAGHFLRRLPLGLYESVTTDRDGIHEPTAHALSAQLRLITRGSLFSAQRWEAIWDLNFGGGLPLDLAAYRFPKDQRFSQPLRTPLDCTVEDHRTAWVAIPSGAKELLLQVKSTYGCQMLWLQGDQCLGGAMLEFEPQARQMPIPDDATAVLLLHEALPFRCEIGGLTFE